MTDPKTARETIDSIMSKLKSEEFNQLIIVVEYSRASTDFYNHLEILERCLNGVIDSSVMLIINKAPNKAQLKKAKKENANFNLDNNLKRLRDEIARIFKFEFSADFILLDEVDDEDDLKENDNEIDQIRNLIGSSQSYKFTNAKKWSELMQMFEESKKSKEDKINLNDTVKSDLKDQIHKISLNINHMESQLEFINRGRSFVTDVKEAVANNPTKYLLKPAIYFSKKMLEKPAEKITTQINNLKKEKLNKEERLATIERDNTELYKEKEHYLIEINRLHKLLREN